MATEPADAEAIPLTVYYPRELYEQIQALAAARYTSLSRTVVWLTKRGLEARGDLEG